MTIRGEYVGTAYHLVQFINQTGQLVSTTVSFNLLPDVPLAAMPARLPPSSAPRER